MSGEIEADKYNITPYMSQRIEKRSEFYIKYSLFSPILPASACFLSNSSVVVLNDEINLEHLCIIEEAIISIIIRQQNTWNCPFFIEIWEFKVLVDRNVS